MICTEIEEGLRLLSFYPRRVVNISRREKGVLIPLPLFRVKLEPNPINPQIYLLQSLLHVRVKVESFKPRTAPPHCRNCQQLGHTKHFCLRAPRCIKCGADHASATCTRPTMEPCTCANCGGAHPANYQGCPEYIRYTKPKPHSAVEEIRRREAPPLQGTPSASIPHIPNSTPSYADISRTTGHIPPWHSVQSTSSTTAMDSQTSTLLTPLTNQFITYSASSPP